MPEVSRDLADKVEAASVRNTIKSVGEGRPLSPAEDDRLQRERLPQIGADELNRERQAALLLKWRKGQRLSEAEKAEIKPFLPSDKAAAKRSTVASKLHNNAHYATVYGVSEKTIKNWCREGREMPSGPDLPPLDAPEKMAAWYARTHPHLKTVPPKLMELARGRSSPASGSHLAPGSPPPPPMVTGDDFEFDDSVRFAAENLKFNQEQLRLARSVPDPVTGVIDERRVAQYEKAVRDSQETYRKTKADEFEHSQRNGQLVDRRIVFSKLRTKLGALHHATRTIGVRVATLMALSPDETRKLVGLINDQLDTIFTQGKEERWIFKDRLTLES